MTELLKKWKPFLPMIYGAVSLLAAGAVWLIDLSGRVNTAEASVQRIDTQVQDTLSGIRSDLGKVSDRVDDIYGILAKPLKDEKK